MDFTFTIIDYKKRPDLLNVLIPSTVGEYKTYNPRRKNKIQPATLLCKKCIFIYSKCSNSILNQVQ
jgi:hypothetical protein